MNAPLPADISVQEVKQLIDNDEKFFFLDCREQNEFDLVSIPQATLIPMSTIQERVGELESYREARIVVHCHLGGRSQRVTGWLRQQGYENAQNMTGGIDVWSQEIDQSLPRYS